MRCKKEHVFLEQEGRVQTSIAWVTGIECFIRFHLSLKDIHCQLLGVLLPFRGITEEIQSSAE